ncbi:MAG: organic solvent tolerance protein [Bdellovibrionaceae bacterium]|nr:organic solvent tolerance protein [Pseudobdellovibrionaceae bacterium]
MRVKSFFALVATILISSSAFAADLTNRLGLGFSQQMGSVDIPMVTAHYYPNARFAISGALGIDTKKDDSKFGVLAKVRRVVFTENQLNFYMGASGGFSSHEEINATTGAVENKSNTEISGILGAEFFFTGLDSLSFMFETGVGVITGDGGTRFRTLGSHPFSAGIVFYF